MDINYIRVGDYYIPDLTLSEQNRRQIDKPSATQICG